MMDGSFPDAATPALIRTRAQEGAVSATAMLCALAGFSIAIHLPGIARYGFFRDELYYIACSEHLARGYVDQPPLIALIAWISRHLLGNSLAAFRVPPILAGAVTVYLTGWLAKELGGGRRAVCSCTRDSLRAVVSRLRQHSHHERLRAGLLARMRLHRSPNRERRVAEVVAAIRTHLGSGTRK